MVRVHRKPVQPEQSKGGQGEVSGHGLGNVPCVVLGTLLVQAMCWSVK